MIFGAYCVGKVHNMLPRSIMINGAYCKVMHTICYLGSIIILGAYCVGMVHNMLPW